MHNICEVGDDGYLSAGGEENLTGWGVSLEDHIHNHELSTKQRAWLCLSTLARALANREGRCA